MLERAWLARRVTKLFGWLPGPVAASSQRPGVYPAPGRCPNLTGACGAANGTYLKVRRRMHGQRA